MTASHVLQRSPSESRRAHDRTSQLLRALADREATSLPLLSVYLDIRPPADAADPRARAARVLLRDRLRHVKDSLPHHGPEHDSFAADTIRLEGLVEDLVAQPERGFAAFACSGVGLFETFTTWSPFEDRIEVGDRPFLVPLARLADSEPAIVALADTNTLRLFAFQPGRLEELPAIDDPPDDYARTEAGGWSQARYQRHVDDHRADFARRAATLIARTAEREDAARLILAGDEVAVPRLREELPKATAEKVVAVLRLELRATLDEVEAEVLPEVERLETEAAHDAADRLMTAAKGAGLGVGGIEATKKALEVGQGLELLLDAEVGRMPGGGEAARTGISDAAANELIRLAALNDARTTFVKGHQGLRSLGGVGAFLRFRV